MRLNLWAASAGSSSRVGEYAAEQARALEHHLDVARVSEHDADAPPPADLDLYHLANAPEHGFVYRAAVTRPGVILLHDWNLQALVFSQARARGDVGSYVRDMRRAHGEPGAFVARQVVRGLAGDLWPALYPLNHPVLEASLAVVTLTRDDAERVTLGFHDLPALALPGNPSGPALARFLRKIHESRERLARAAASRRPEEGSLKARLLDEARAATHELGLGGMSLGIEPLL